MPYYSFYLVCDVRAYSGTRAIEAPNRDVARVRLQEMLSNDDLDLTLDVNWDSTSDREIEFEGECEADDYPVVDSAEVAAAPEPDTMTAPLLLRPAVEVVSGLAFLSRREKEISDER